MLKIMSHEFTIDNFFITKTAIRYIFHTLFKYNSYSVPATIVKQFQNRCFEYRNLRKAVKSKTFFIYRLIYECSSFYLRYQSSMGQYCTVYDQLPIGNIINKSNGVLIRPMTIGWPSHGVIADVMRRWVGLVMRQLWRTSCVSAHWSREMVKYAIDVIKCSEVSRVIPYNLLRVSPACF